ncbi:YceI family protein [Chitinophaga skermanii]|nr:YceI family protein [Chitinophaga skermanii]
MNNKLFMYISLLAAVLFSNCQTSQKKEKAVTPSSNKGEVYAIDTKESVITWTGTMVLSPDKEHTGFVYLSNGAFIVENGQLIGGSAVINLHSLAYKDKSNTNTPIHHLKSPDYFDVEKFPTSAIVITNVTTESDKTILVTGKLTIKGVTRLVTFPASMELKDGVLTANGKLVIDRTDWGIRYRSGKFYDVVADQVVSDEIGFLIKIIARKTRGC